MKEETKFRIEYWNPAWPSGRWQSAYNVRRGKHVTADTLEDAKRELTNTKRRMRMYVLEFRIVKRVTTEEVVDL